MYKIEFLTKPDVAHYIHQHQYEDPAALALKTPPYPDWPWRDVISQIKARQKAAVKMPSWTEAKEIIFPEYDVIEQASSEATAHYKAKLCKGDLIADLTAGTGIDFFTLLQNFKCGIAIESNAETAAMLAHNASAFGIQNIEVQCAQAEEAIKTLPFCDLIFIDPQRRSSSHRKIVQLNDCMPDVTKILPLLLAKAKMIMIKASPMLDVDKALQDLKNVSAVHIVEWKNECKEVLYFLQNSCVKSSPPIVAASINDKGDIIHTFEFSKDEEKVAQACIGLPEKFLYEPSPAFQKAGCFKLLSERLKIKKLHPHTHLYTSENFCGEFPGRSFSIHGLYPASGKGLKIKKANLSIRNFPGSADSLRSKLGLLDGGEEFLFAATLADNQKALIHARKI